MGRMKIKKTRVIKMNAETENILKRQLEKFRQRFGREPGPTDPVFFDPASDTPRAITEDQMMTGLRDAAVKAGIDVSGLSDDEIAAFSGKAPTTAPR